MILFGKKHPLLINLIDTVKFEDVIENWTFVNNGSPGHFQKGKFFENELIDGKKYFMYAELPLFSPDRDIEYYFNFEDQMTMYKYMSNGFQTENMMKDSYETDLIRYVLESKKCKKIVCHIEKMTEAFPKLLNSSIIKDKIIYKRIGIEKKEVDFNKKSDKFTILFTNSFYDDKNSFFLRGGHLLLNCFKILADKYKNLELVIRSSIRDDLRQHLNHPRIKVVDAALSELELDSLYKDANLVVLLAARIHTHSLCRAFTYGIPAITSNGWAFDEYIQQNINGYIVEGFDNISSHHEKYGIIENYSEIGKISQELHSYITEQTCYYIETLINNEDHYMNMRKNTKHISDTLYSPDNWYDWVN